MRGVTNDSPDSPAPGKMAAIAVGAMMAAVGVGLFFLSVL